MPNIISHELDEGCTLAAIQQRFYDVWGRRDLDTAECDRALRRYMSSVVHELHVEYGDRIVLQFKSSYLWARASAVNVNSRACTIVIQACNAADDLLLTDNELDQ